jgi:hypothetical protein
MFGRRFLRRFGARACGGTRAVGGRRFGAGSRHATRRLWNSAAETKLILVTVFILTVFLVFVFFVIIIIVIVIIFIFEVKIFIADFVDGIFRVFVFIIFFFVRENDEVIEIFIVGACCRSRGGSGGLSFGQGRCDVGRGG